MSEWQTKEENLKFEDNRFKVFHNQVISPNGKELTLKKIIIKPGAHFVGLTTDGKIPLIRQYRYPADETFLEVPSGGVDIDKESYKDAAIREFSEETGYIPEDVKFVGRFFHSPSLDFPYEIFFSKNLKTGETNLEDSEFGSEVVLLTYDQCMEKIRTGEIHDSSTVACLTVCREKGYL